MNTWLHYRARQILAALVLSLLFFSVGAVVLAQDEQIIASEDGALSVHVPTGWVFRSLGASSVYSTALVFAEDSTVLEGAIASFLLGSATPPGEYGVLVVVEPGFWSLFSAYPEDALFSVLQNATSNPAAPLSVNSQFQYTLGNLYDAFVMDASTAATHTRSYIGGFIVDNDMILVRLSVSPINDFEAARPEIERIGDTIRVPAEQGALTAVDAFATPTQGRIQDLPTRVLPTTAPSALPTLTEDQLSALESDIPNLQDAPEQTAAPEDELVLASSSDQRMSFLVPGSWIVYDLMGDYDIYAYGDTDAAGYSRLGSVRPDLVNPPVPITGIGGVIMLYPMSDFGIDPLVVDLEPLMDRLLQNLTASGYEVVEETRPLYVDPSEGIYVVVHGGEYGYIALVPYGDEVAYITATGSDEASFEANRFLLEGIVLSISVPAFVPTPEATPLPGLGGLGGLGGLQQATAVPTTAGLGGLGDLQPTVTPEVNATEEQQG
ncbi:MAG: hypothetical protein IT319_09775 [Anaerolineae bacterium]|nr:hypothetical protein [Anaerolineae bacterium]